MKLISLKTMLVATLAFSVVACGSNNTQRRVTTGAAIGGATGYVLSSGDPITTLGAAALGGLAGGVYDNHKNAKYKDNSHPHSGRGKFKHSRGRGHGARF